ncbi:MAG: M2 family metallopeptidase [candidate division KSB1 bacterium]|nr:M2 family metallopeptidase [candidate division KSB1 bacterium]
MLLSCASPQKRRAEAQAFIDEYTAKLKGLYYAANEAEWALNTKIVEGDTTNAVAARQAREALSNFTGSIENIDKTRALLRHKQDLLPLQVKQLEKILYAAANNPQTVADLVKARIKAETGQTEKLFGFDFKIDGKSVTTNQIDDILKKETDLAKRLQAWEASKEVGKVLKDGLENLQRLRNQTVQALGYSDYFSYQVSDYGMSTAEMMALMQQLNRDLRPLYRELHTYGRYELAKRYGVQEVPDMIPAHWLPNRWGQDWSAMITAEGVDLDGALRQKTAEWLVRQGEDFYVSLGFPKLPPVFWEKSSLYPLPPEAKYKKNNHASAWHLDLENDVRSLMSVEPNAEWYETVNHELGHVYYFMAYTNPEVPVILREGANRAYHEAIGSLMGLAAMQKPFIENLRLIPANAQADEQKLLLKEALSHVVFIPFSAGVMSEFEHDLYARNLPKDQYNRRWWELCEKYQGMTPPSPRGEEFCDAASKTHINDDAAQYYDYALSYVILFQLHDHIATKILRQEVRATNYYGSREVGDFLRDIMRPGASRDWREVLREKTGEDLSARAMLKYFEPLLAYLQEANKGRTHTLGDI